MDNVKAYTYIYIYIYTHMHVYKHTDDSRKTAVMFFIRRGRSHVQPTVAHRKVRMHVMRLVAVSPLQS